MNSLLNAIDRLREETPGCAERIHLNNAGAGLMPQPVLDAIQQYLERESQIGGYEAADESNDTIQTVYADLAELLGTGSNNIAFVENATVGFAQALSCIPFQTDDVILTTSNDYISNQIMFMSLSKRLGVRIIHANDSPEGGVHVESMRQLMDEHNPRLVSVTHIPTNSGLVQPVEEIGELCRQREIFYLVDACQSVGQMPLNVQKIGCDLLSASSRKFLRGPRGCGFLFVSDRLLHSGLEPLFVDMRGAKWTDSRNYRMEQTAKRFENWEFAYALVLGTGQAARYALDLGLENISRRSFGLAKQLREACSAIPGVRILDEGLVKWAIVTIHIEGVDPSSIVANLRQQKINTSLTLREYAVMDFDHKKVDWALRVSPHYYNTETEIAAVVRAIENLTKM